MLRRNVRNKAFDGGRMVAKSSVAHSESKNRLERVRLGTEKKIPPCSVQGENSDYDTEGDEQIQKVLATLPPLASSSTTSQPPATGSGAGQQPPPPWPSKAGLASLSQQAIHKTPPPSVSEQAKEPTLSSSVAKFFDDHKALEQKGGEQKKAKAAAEAAARPAMAPPGMASVTSRIGTPSPQELEVVQEVLDRTASQVPAESPSLCVVTTPDQVRSPVPTLSLTPQPDQLKAPVDLPEVFMETEASQPEKAAGAEDIEMASIESTAQAAAVAVPAAGAVAEQSEATLAIEVEESDEEEGELSDIQAVGDATDGYEEESDIGETDDQMTQYQPVINSVANFDDSWLTCLKSYDIPSVLQAQYRSEGLEYG